MTDAEARAVVLLLEACLYEVQAVEACRDISAACTTHVFTVVRKGVGDAWYVAVDVMGDRVQEDDPHD